MKKINTLFAKIKESQKEAKILQEKEFALLDKLHAAILEEILKGDLFRKMAWRIPPANYSCPMIDRIDATKDENWKKIEELLGKCGSISWTTSVVSLNDYVALDIEGGVVSLFPRQRDTNGQRDIKPPTTTNKEYHIFMHEQLLSFVKKYKLRVDFAEVEKQLERLKNDVKIVENTISFCKELNSSLDR